MTEMFDDFFDEITAKDTPAKNTKKEKAVDGRDDESNKKTTVTSYKFPFQIHFGGEMHEVSHIFTEEQSYTEKEITDTMLAHQFYEFSGSTSYKYIKEDNVLVPMFVQHKKG